MSGALAWVGVALLGGAGAVARFALDGAVQRRVRGVLPLGTLAVNILGTFALGLLTGAGVAGDAMLLAGTATIGSFTTFSTWMLESHRLAEDGEGYPALANLAGSLVQGLAAGTLGWLLGSLL